MQVSQFINQITESEKSFIVGVPDSLLKPLNNYLFKEYGISENHIIAANEGNAVALAAGYHLATGNIPIVYLQNSGIGNMVNPIISLVSNRVYGIPCIFIIGWRGEPGVHDEPQHVFQGEITEKILSDIDIPAMVVGKETTVGELKDKMKKFRPLLQVGKSVAFIIRKDALIYKESVEYTNDNQMIREEIIKAITSVSGEGVIVSTTGKTSRELFEIRERGQQTHKYDFLTVGSMGHSSSIALGIALNKPDRQVWCIDGDGAALMHMGAMAIIGASAPANYIHILINNAAHESVGGQPTVADKINFCQIALGCGYKKTYKIKSYNELNDILPTLKDEKGPLFVEIKATIGSRSDLGRPTLSPKENKELFMKNLMESDK